MTVPTIADYLGYANLQMAAEAFIQNEETLVLAGSGETLVEALKAGNGHASRFTETQATAFAGQWEVLDQRANTNTGFSGTLFKAIKDNIALGIKKDDLVVSFRSTEFIDDAARDNEATNTQEIFKFGFAFGQLADMEKWYADLSREGGPLDGKTFSVTGYSLGAHLATAFNLLHPGIADRVITFNGAGIGKVGDGSLSGTQASLREMIGRFRSLLAQAATSSGLEGTFTSPEALVAYRTIKGLIADKHGVPNAAMDSAIPRSDWESLPAVAKQELTRLGDALAAAVKVATEADRVLIADRLTVDNTRRKRRGGRHGDPAPDATNQTLWRKAA